MRLVLAALAGFALAVVPAVAADHSVKSVEGDRWSPAELTVAQGDRVVWTNDDGGFHNVHFEDESFTQPPTPSSTWTSEVSRTFDTAGTYRYYCQAHEDTMKGTVVVGAGGTTGTTGTTTTTTQTTTGTTTQTTTTTTEQPPPPAPVVTVRATRSSFCVRKSRRCRRPGVVLRITSDTPHRVEGRLLRPNGVFGTVAFDVPAGTRTVRFTRTSSGRRLSPGRYSLKLGTAPVVRFRVRR